MVTLRARAHAKVNLHLEVLHRRDDGYHEIETILQSLELHDVITVKPTEGPIRVLCEHPDVPTDRTNLCHRAAKLLKRHLGVSQGAEIHIEKNIPVAAGLGGGSTDAAACFSLLPRLWKSRLAEEDAVGLAVQIGADVPFFLRGGLQLARGIGEELTPLTGSGDGWYLVVCPAIPVSTAWVYEHLRMGLTHAAPRVNLTQYRALLSRFPARAWPGFNRLGDVVFPAFPALHNLYLHLRETQPRLAMLSGSGSAVYGVYSTLDRAREAKDSLELGDVFHWIGRSTRVGVTPI